MSSKHTPGPWSVGTGSRRTGFTVKIAADELLVGGHGLKSEANARLIAAAPEGLEVAEFVYQALLRHPVDAWRIRADGQQSLCMLRSFIASATGKSEQEVQEFYEAAVAGEAACAT